MANDTTPVPRAVDPAEGESKATLLRKHPWLKPASVLIPVLVSSIATYISAGSTSQQKAAEVKDQAEAGFQDARGFEVAQNKFNKGLVEDLQKLKAEVAELKRRQIRPVKRKEATKAAAVAAVPAPTPPPPVPPIQLAPNLDKALEQVQKKAAEPAAVP